MNLYKFDKSAKFNRGAWLANIMLTGTPARIRTAQDGTTVYPYVYGKIGRGGAEREYRAGDFGVGAMIYSQKENGEWRTYYVCDRQPAQPATAQTPAVTPAAAPVTGSPTAIRSKARRPRRAGVAAATAALPAIATQPAIDVRGLEMTLAAQRAKWSAKLAAMEDSAAALALD